MKGLKEVVDLINAGIMPKGASYSVMEQKMNGGDLAMMISGPWAWANLRKSGIDFGLAPAFQIATNGQAPPEAALAEAKKNMEK